MQPMAVQMRKNTIAAASWEDLFSEFRSWRALGEPATLWWRDDDAVAADPALDRMLGLAAGTPLSLAVIPGRFDPSLVGALEAYGARHGNLAILQHGWIHANHAGPDGKKAELGPSRPVAAIAAELKEGAQRLRRAFRDRVLRALAPPWNRLADALIPLLPELGFDGLSTFGPRRAAHPVAGLAQVNTHVDLVDWVSGGGFVGEETALGALVGHLSARRLGHADRAEPTGILTHHLRHDGALDAFLGRLVAATSSLPGVRWIGLGDALAAA
jgi:hypothetical protein